MMGNVSTTGAILFSYEARTILGRFSRLEEDEIEAVCSTAHLGPAVVICVSGIPENSIQFILGVSSEGPVTSLVSQNGGIDRTHPLDLLKDLMDDYPECDIGVWVLIPNDAIDIPQGLFETTPPFLEETPPGWICLGIDRIPSRCPPSMTDEDGGSS